MNEQPNTITLQCGVTLGLKAVNTAILRSIIAGFEGVDKIAQNPNSLLKLTGSRQIKAMEAAEKLYSYCFGWGVVNDPPEDDPILALAPDNPPARRGIWIRSMAADDQELGEIIGRVMTLTFGNQQPQTADNKKDAQIAKLQEQLNQMKGRTGEQNGKQESDIYAAPV